jgi:hypothetical protein
MYGGEERCMQVLVGTPEGRRPLGRSRNRWECNIKMDLREVRLRGIDWIGLAQGHVAGCCELGNEPSGSIKCREFIE